MNTLQIYDPAVCCSTGIWGPDVDPELANFAALLSQLQQRGVKVERYNLGQQPVAFVQNAQVKTSSKQTESKRSPSSFTMAGYCSRDAIQPAKSAENGLACC